MIESRTVPVGKRIIKITILLLWGVATASYGQISFRSDQSIPVRDKNGQLLTLAWSGGINAAQFSKMDLDNDGMEDLVLYDRMATKVITFLNVNSQWKYAPEYESLFPDLVNWLLLVDFNCDGKKDIFTGDPFGMKVYRNTSTQDKISWEQYDFYDDQGRLSIALLSKLSNSKGPVQLRFDDLPALIDADHDGDLDILNVTFSSSGSVEYHRNFSMERYGKCDSLDFERVTRSWGDFTQCQCEDFAYNGDGCGTNTNAKELHASGKALLAADMNGDNVHDIFYSEGDCSEIFLLQNNGTVDAPVIAPAKMFPESQPLSMFTFPSAFFEDVDFDGVGDVIITPNVYRRDYLDQEFKNSTWLYKNFGSAQTPDFRLVNRAFLQDKMIEVGDNAVPSFTDIDWDGDQDLFISNATGPDGFSTITFYRNVGNIIEPSFEFVTDDYLGLSSMKVRNMKIQFVDMNSDGRADLTFSAAKANSLTYVYIFFQSVAQTFDLSNGVVADLILATVDNYHFTDVNMDGKMDALVGRFTGNLEYYRNTSSGNTLTFSSANSTFLGINSSVSRQSMTCYADDLNDDGKTDLIISNQNGEIGVIEDYRNASFDDKVTDIFYNSILEENRSSALGRVWPVSARLFGDKNPSIVAGTIRGGLEIYRNEKFISEFEDLTLEFYPNPVRRSQDLTILSNAPINLNMLDTDGQTVLDIIVKPGKNLIPMYRFSPGMYFLNFNFGNDLGMARVIVTD